MRYALFAVLTLATSLEAQERRASTPPAPAPAPARAAQPRVGYAGTPAPPPQPVVVAPPVYYVSPGEYLVSGPPYLALADGSVLVNFGNGYERVLRACAPARNSTPVDPWARDALGRIPEPPGIAALREGTRGQVTGATPPRNAAACYRNDAQGRVEVVRY